MKRKSKRLRMRHEVSDSGKVDRIAQKSFTKETSHKVETGTGSGGFFSGIKRILSKFFGFKRRPQAQHYGVSTKSYCQKFGGAFGGTLPGKSDKSGRRRYRPYSTYTNGTVGNKLAKKLTIHIPSKGII